MFNRKTENAEKGLAREQGFTLIELLVTVTIIGILTAIVSIGVGGATTGASTAANKGVYYQVQASADAFTGAGNTISGTVADSTGSTTPENLKVTQCVLADLNPGGNCDNASTVAAPSAVATIGRAFYSSDGATKPAITVNDFWVTIGSSNTTNRLVVGGWLRANAISSTGICTFKGSGGNPTSTLLGCSNK